MNTTENHIIIQLRMVAKKISTDKEILMATAMLAISNAMADPKVQKAIERGAVSQLKKK